ncbi:hypothetical protein RHMOL_Rhmol10G0089800 [Rhododendron molle]|uniref:Uncharacterized protein n=1 Tax=Rhododendron molle TaxID=49168 RepID=A0ACC0M0J8_RHOML|nr:hypothetical protein RHMOL_Rhmol10G0089800 [Rhododendron molle]
MATFFLPPPPPLQNPNPISRPYISTPLSLPSNSFRNPKPIHSSQNPFSSSPAEPNSHSSIKIPTAPWMTKSPLLLNPNHLSKPKKKPNSENPERPLTEKISGGRGKKAMKRIFEGIGKLRETHYVSKETRKNPEKIELDFVFTGGEEDGDGVKGKGRMPWESNDRVVFRRVKKEKVVTAAELRLDGELLERLRGEAGKMRKWVSVKKIGVSQAVVDQVRLIWKGCELVMIKFDVPLCRNMDRAREIVETKTGGLVVWSKKDALVVYRGCNFQPGLRTSMAQSGFPSHHKFKDKGTLSQLKSDASTREENMSRHGGETEILPINGSLYEREADRILDGLGPRFIDWWRPKPLPVDADLLPEVVPGFKPPFRRCPPHGRVKLTDDELTYLRMLAQQLPFHFVLGTFLAYWRNRKLQGLAAAILKLWEKCHIVKIAVKWGIPNTDNAQMAYELKASFMTLRGKDFLPRGVENLVAEREVELNKCQLQEEDARLKASSVMGIETYFVDDESSVKTRSGTLSEYKDIQSESAILRDGNSEVKVELEAEKERLKKQLRNQARKLYILKMKIKRSARELEKVNSTWRPAEQDADQEMITEEERTCFRKIGLKLTSSLVLGRRGVFDGVIEGLRQHWKHREIVKVITMQRVFSQVMYTAQQLEAESGGILVSVDKLKEGHAIIIYRGKNYRRPLISAPQNLLNKREALHRSLEMQRIGSLKFFAYQRQREIYELECKLETSDLLLMASKGET